MIRERRCATRILEDRDSAKETCVPCGPFLGTPQIRPRSTRRRVGSKPELNPRLRDGIMVFEGAYDSCQRTNPRGLKV